MRNPYIVIVLIFLLNFLIQPAFEAQSQQNNDTGEANIRIAHFSIDTPIINMLVNEELSRVQGLSFGEISDWYTLPSGNHTLQIISNLSQDLPDPADFTFRADTWTTIAIIGTSGRESVKLHAIPENYNELGRGEARIGIFQGIEGLAALDMTSNGEILFQFVNYPGTTTDLEDKPNDGFVSTPIIANTYEIQLLANHASAEVVIDLSRVQLIANNNYFIAAIGTPENPFFTRATTNLTEIRRTTRSSLIIENDIESDQFIRIAHFSSGTPALDIYVDSETLVTDLRFANITDFIPLPANAQAIAIVPAGLSLNDALLDPINVTFTTEKWLTASIVGTLDNNSLGVELLEEDFSDLTETDVRVSIFQAIPGVGPMNVEIDDIIRIRLLGYPGSQGNNDGMESFDLIDGEYDLVIRSAVNNEIIVNLENQRFIGGRSYLIATIRANPPYVFRSVDVVEE